jgi:hypothetical protein
LQFRARCFNSFQESSNHLASFRAFEFVSFLNQNYSNKQTV